MRSINCNGRSIQIGAIIAALVLAPAAVAEELVDRPALDDLVQPLIDNGWLSGVAIGIADERGTAMFGYGRISEADPRPPDGETVFEIGSITKVFTGLLLAQMAESGEVRLDMPVRELLPTEVSVPKSDDREITLVDLATHSSGLPRLPSNLLFTNPADPYADYTVENMYTFLGEHQLRRAPGVQSEYSNLGVGLLGHVLALRAKQSYEELMRERIADPLGMRNTRVVLTDEMRRHLAEPHDVDGRPVKNWDIPTFAGAGGVRSTIDDMTKFLSASLGLIKTPWAAAMRESQQVHFDNHDERTGVGLGWQLNMRDGLVWHNGQTGGYRTYMGLKPAKHAGVIVLCNTSADRAVDPLGYRILNLLTGGHPRPLELPKPMPVDAEARQKIVGSYRADGRRMMSVRDEEGELLVRFGRGGPHKLLAESADKFFLRSNGSISVTRDDDGQVISAKVELPDRQFEATRRRPTE